MATALAERRRAEPDLLAACRAALAAAASVRDRARDRLAARLAPGGRLDPERLEREQHAAHGLAWLEVHVRALEALLDWAERLRDAGRLGELERLQLAWGFAEYLARLAGGWPMAQGEIVRPHELGLGEADLRPLRSPELEGLVREGATPEARRRLAELLEPGALGDPGILDDSLELVRDQFRRFAEERIRPEAHRWHLADALIPDAVLAELAELGVFGLTVPESYGGLGMSKLAMCLVTEELSRGYIGVGSLPTRNEIAGELVATAGTPEQKARFLPRLASGELIPTAVFTEPNIGSDLAHLETRAVLEDGFWRVTGQKTWITHAARADFMTILCRTRPERGHKGLSILLAEKPRGTEANPFPVEGLTGGEIPVLGYRGMKEYTLSFDRFAVPADNLLGGVEGQGFKQLMATFESARIQTAARAVGVAVAAIEEGLAYARERKQFGKPLLAFPRVHQKLAWAAVETQLARQLTFLAARAKDEERRCDLEAGLAKLLAAQVAWMAADNALQVHGGNGYALEYPISRILCDARILNIFEGAAEIQAQVVARRLLEG
ncbi:MAG: acyl-CoA dehydrogenase family protein [Geminicoccaceae bacterium]|nr:acyl-CoA dehydrogenase family protein [Geminicoccaceae bacterium]